MNYFTKHSHIPSPQSSRADSAYEEEASLIPKSNFKKGTDIDVVAERVRLLAGDDGNDDDDEEENSMVVKVDIDEDECGPGG